MIETDNPKKRDCHVRHNPQRAIVTAVMTLPKNAIFTSDMTLPKNAIVLGGSDDVLFACGLYFIQTKSYRSDLHLMHAPPVEREMKRLQMLAKANYPMKRDTFLTLNMSRPWQFIMQLLDALPGAQIFLLDISLQPNKHYYELLQKSYGKI